jgi:uncharacterized damage-inducible protein DinB
VAADLRPRPDEYAPYYESYVHRIVNDDPFVPLDRQPGQLIGLLGYLSDAAAGFRYGPGKWSVREVVGHVADTERIFAYRALRIARGDTTPLPSFDENAYVTASGADTRLLAEILEEFEAVRAATWALFHSLPDEAFDRMGTASDHPVSVRALLSITLGHAAHHLAVLRERYLAHPSFPR